jgi:hypothetical protein
MKVERLADSEYEVVREGYHLATFDTREKAEAFIASELASELAIIRRGDRMRTWRQALEEKWRGPALAYLQREWAYSQLAEAACSEAEQRELYELANKLDSERFRIEAACPGLLSQLRSGFNYVSE